MARRKKAGPAQWQTGVPCALSTPQQQPADRPAGCSSSCIQTLQLGNILYRQVRACLCLRPACIWRQLGSCSTQSTATHVCGPGPPDLWGMWAAQTPCHVERVHILCCSNFNSHHVLCSAVWLRGSDYWLLIRRQQWLIGREEVCFKSGRTVHAPESCPDPVKF